ncbi:MAG: hypothetical protein HY376_02285, partial [Candidatus Blackburnbacteria bacterium]|nr:hypothetical protein [Candidatus Blackburnbacteria bacterium]
MNYGLIESIPSPTDLLLGEQSPDVLSPARDFGQFLPVVEYQKRNFETSACVTFSGLNSIETLLKVKYRLDFNFSDRFTAKMSKTIPGWGNTFVRVANSVRHDGVVDETFLPWMGSSV